MKKIKFGFVFFSLILCFFIFVEKASANSTPKRVSVHDPSIFLDNGTYYIFGSHLAQAKSTDLLNWDPLFSSEYENPSPLLGDLDTNLKKVFEWAGYDDADTAGGKYSIWAPDMIYNENYIWEDGSKGAYMYYFSSSSTWRRSVIGFAVSKNVEGPFEFVDTLIYSGFTKEDATDGSNRNVNYKNTNINELIENGTLKDGFSDNWSRGTTTYNNDYAPNAIDANVYFDKNGKLWLVYGSWSGGIYTLELDSTTGKAIYPGIDRKTEDGRVIDRYFGTHLLGGWHQSGEAPYVVYDKNTDYYYLFVTYGGLSRTGGYNMRLFRSRTPDGEFVDAKGNNPQYSYYTADPINNEFGIKVMGNYQFNCLSEAYMSPGHNSAFIDEDGNWFLVYHTRFNGGTEYHEVRVHQMVMTENDWPVSLPYEYTGKEPSNINLTQNNVIGEYEFVNNGTESSGNPIPKQTISLNKDGTVTGDFDGTWTIPEEGTITLKEDQTNTKYSGKYTAQQNESSNRKNVLVFSAVGDNNEVIWGSKQFDNDVPEKITLDQTNLKVQKMNTQFQVTPTIFPEVASNADVTWSTSNNNIATIDKNGLVTTLKPGITRITATTTNGKVASFILRVTL